MFLAVKRKLASDMQMVSMHMFCQEIELAHGL